MVVAGRHHPQDQWTPPWGGSLLGRADFADVDDHLLLEVDGRRWHTKVADFETDHRRDQLAVMAGWRVLRFTWKQIQGNPSQVAETIRTTLGLTSTPFRGRRTV